MFNPAEYLTKLKGKDYLEVKWRLAWFRDQHPHGVISTTLVHLDTEKGMALFKASIDDADGGHAEGHGSETSKDFGDYIEKAETKAIGRALASLGYGTQFAPDLEEGERIVDSPVVRSNANTRPSAPSKQPAGNAASGEVLTVSSLRARFDVVKPSNKDGAISFENFYKMATKKPFTADDAISPEECQRINQQLDVIVRARANKQQSA